MSLALKSADDHLGALRKWWSFDTCKQLTMALSEMMDEMMKDEVQMSNENGMKRVMCRAFYTKCGWNMIGV